MKEIPNTIYSGIRQGGHVQGIAIDKERGFVYYSFTTMLLKTDLLGNTIGSVVNLAGHLGCITYDADRNLLYGSIEFKHDAIGNSINKLTGENPCAEDNFYLVCFDCDKIVKMDMNAELGDVAKSVHLADIVKDYTEIDEISGKENRYGCSGCDGTGYGPIFGEDKNSPKKIMIAYGIRNDVSRTDNDYQVILQYDPSIFELYGKPLNAKKPHKSGPTRYEEKYFLYTGNTHWGCQNLEYDEFTQMWLVAVYKGKKPAFINFPMFFIDGKIKAKEQTLIGRGTEKGLVLSCAKMGERGNQEGIYGSWFAFGSTGIASLGDGTVCFSEEGSAGNNEGYMGGFFTNIKKYRFSNEANKQFELVE